MDLRRPPRRLGSGLAALCIAAIAAACSSSDPRGGATGPGSPGIDRHASASARLAAAEALVEANRYDDAEAAFTRLLAADAGDPAVLDAHALLLAGRRQTAAAVREAEAATAADPRGGRAWAVLCRARDWDGRLDAAVSAGGRAVALAPADPLGHLFLAEALADRGDLAAARSRLAAARALVSPGSAAFARAELGREEGVIAEDAGDRAGEVAGFLAAWDAQPGSAERASELAAAYLDAGDVVAARNALQSAVALAPDDAEILGFAARVALLRADIATAGDAVDRLLRVRPADPTVLEIAAEVAVAGHADVDAGVALLERALVADPRDSAAAAYLIHLESGIRRDPERGAVEVAAALAGSVDDAGPRARHPAAADPAAVARDHAGVALEALNRIRGGAGLPAVVLDDRLVTSATDHCYYWLFNEASPSVAGLRIHEESAGLAAFRGAGPDDRAEAAGWHDGPVGEDITHRGSAAAAMADWLDSVYHRFPLLRPDLHAIGYADCAIGPLPMEDLELGFGASADDYHAPVLYPPAQARGVPASFVDNELPDPVPAGAARTTGYPVTVTFDVRQGVQLIGFSLSDTAGRPVDAHLLAPSQATQNSASLLPSAPLTRGATYTARISAYVGGRLLERSWQFTVSA